MSRCISLLVLIIIASLVVAGVPSVSGGSGYTQSSYIGPPLLGRPARPLQPNTELWLSFFLPPSGGASIDFMASQVSLKHMGPLSQEQVLSRYAPNQTEFNSLIGFLKSHGFTIVYTSPDRFSVEAYATVSTVESLFHTVLYTYNYNDGYYYAPLTPPQIPSELYGVEISGLTNRTLIQPQYLILGELNGTRVTASKLPHSTPSVGLTTAATYYGPKVLQGAYGVSTLLSQGYGGRGQSVAIIDAYGDPLIQQDLAAFDREFGLPPVNLTIVPIGPYHPEYGVSTGWDVETALDVEAVHSMAPYAHIYLVVGFNPVDVGNALFEAIDYVVSTDIANVTSMSWGIPENLFGESGFYYSGALNYPYADYYFALGVAEGISFLAASGDQGAYSGTPTTMGGVSFPASSPFVTAVGGTTLYVNVTSGSISKQDAGATYSYEEAWSVSPDYSGATVSSGGGYSTLFPRPWYQSGVDQSVFRSVPDVAADANPYTGFITIVEGQKMVIGGTSLATPLWAGMTSLLDEYLNEPLGLLNTYLYRVYNNATLYAQAFHQITFGYNGAYYASKGYNLVTGLGSPNLAALAQAIKSLPQNLDISVTIGGSGSTYPQFNYGSTAVVGASITFPNGTQVTSGSFTAYIYNSNGEYGSVPLSYNGSEWVGTFVISPGAPPNTWSVVVEGASAGYTGAGGADIQVGLSVAILQPVPYPYGPLIPPNQPFTVAAAVTYPNGSPAVNATVTAVFERNGSPIFSVDLFPVEPGVYAGGYALLPNMPQGVYTMVVNASLPGQMGEAYTYEYFGEALSSTTIITPSLDALPSASVGQTITLYTQSITASGEGLFTSNVTAEFYYPSGGLAAKVQLKPAPNIVQYGLLNLFSTQQANFTIPPNFTAGFYTVVFNSTYNGSLGVERGVYTTALYISNTDLAYHIHAVSQALEGQTITVRAKITYPNGTPVTRGVFMVTAQPVNYNYLGLVLQEATGVPMQYSAPMGVWIANITLPSTLKGGFYAGLPQSYLSGAWNLVLTGETANGVQVQQSNFYINVLPYTYINIHLITPANLSSTLLATNSSGLSQLNGVGGVNLTLKGVTLKLTNDYFSGLTIEGGSQVTIVDSTLSNVNITYSNVTLIGCTITGGSVGVNLENSTLTVLSSVFSNLTYAYNPVSSTILTGSTTYSGVSHVSTLPPPTFKLTTPSTITGAISRVVLDVTGSQIRVVGVTLNGAPVNFSVEPISGGVQVVVPFSSSSNPDGVYTLSVGVSSGLSYTQTFNIVNLYHQSLTNLITYVVLGILVVIAIFMAVYLGRKGSRGGGST
ncbi:MAG: protease pro-enzyme activation domain-containing protein [Thermoprotei archaeon]